MDFNKSAKRKERNVFCGVRGTNVFTCRACLLLAVVAIWNDNRSLSVGMSMVIVISYENVVERERVNERESKESQNRLTFNQK